MPSLFIDGQWVASGDGTCSKVINPSDATVVTEVDVATDEDDPPTRPITPTPLPVKKPAEDKPGFTLTPPEPTPAVSPARHPRAQTPVPVVGSSLLARSAPSKLPWILVAALVVAVLGLVAYIVMK